MQEWIVGEAFSLTQDKGEGVYFEADEGGYTLVYNFSNPTAKEIASVKEGEPFEIQYTKLDDILYFTVKAGALQWVDAPFAPWLSDRYGSLIMPPENLGTALTVCMVDAETNILKSIRLIGLGHSFSVSLLQDIQKIRERRAGLPVDVNDYYRDVMIVQQRYTTKELAKMATTRFKLRNA